MAKSARGGQEGFPWHTGHAGGSSYKLGISINLAHGGLQVWGGLTLTKPSEMDMCVNRAGQFINSLMKNTAVLLADPSLFSLYVTHIGR